MKYQFKCATCGTEKEVDRSMRDPTADQKAGGCRAKYIIKSEFNNYTITGFIEPGDYQEVSK